MKHFKHTQPTTRLSLIEQCRSWYRQRQGPELQLRLPTLVETLTYAPPPGFNPVVIPAAFESQLDLPIRSWWATEVNYFKLAVVLASLIWLATCVAAHALLTPILIMRLCLQMNLRIRRVGTFHLVCLGLTSALECGEIWEWYYYVALLSNAYYTQFLLSSHVVLPPLPTLKVAEIRRMVIRADTPGISSHSHPLLAATRNAADDSMDDLILSNGLVPYSIQLSKRDLERGVAGVLSPMWHCDTHAPPRCDPIPDQAVIRMTNVDYYVDWNDYFWMCRPIMVHTFTPADPCGTFQESQWTVGVDNVVTMRVAGGGVYRHRLWDYDVESLEAVYPGMTIVYSVTRVPVNQHWSIITMIPIHRKPNHSSSAPHHTLRRSVFCHEVLTMNGTTRWSAVIQRQGADAVMSLSVPGEYVSLAIPATLRSIISARIRLAKLAIHDLVVLLAPTYGDDVRFAQAMIFSAFPVETSEVWLRHTPWNAVDARSTYRKIAAPQLMPKEKIVARVIASPVLDTAFVPAKSYANDLWTIQERIVAVANPADRLDPQYQTYANEFAALFIPTPGVLAPVEVSQVIESQKRPSQVRSNTAAAPGLADWLAWTRTTIRSFQKAEVYPSIKDPRNISTLPTPHCLQYSTYTQAVAAYIKRFSWYAFGMHPNDVATRVYDIASICRHLVETDFSRFDGTHSLALYDFERTILLRAFPESTHPMIKTVHRVMTTSPASTACGVKYDIGGSRLSGSADTSLMNTIDNAYVAFCVFRRMGLSPVEAWGKLGIYGGDDGITPDADSMTYERVSADLGLKLKARATAPTSPCSFLGRVYPCPAATAGHMCDLPRQLAKLHVFPGQDITATKEMILFNRANGYLVTDPNTPIISEWCRLVLRSVPTGLTTRLDLRSWDSKLASDWDAGLSRAEMEDQACRMLGIARADLLAYCSMLDHAVSVDTIQPLRASLAPAIVPGVIVGDDLHVKPSDGKRAAPPPDEVEEKPLIPDGVRTESVIPILPKPPVPIADGHAYGGKFNSDWTPEHLQKLRLDPEALYSMTPLPVGIRVYDALLNNRFKYTSAIDMTAGGGGDTIALARHMPVIAMEINPARCALLRNNVEVAKAVYPTARSVTVMECESLSTLKALPLEAAGSRLVIIDPPWGGPLRDRASAVTLGFNGKPLAQAVQSILNRTDVGAVVVKLPPEFDRNRLIIPGTQCYGYTTKSMMYVVISFATATVRNIPGLSTWKVVNGVWMRMEDAPRTPAVAVPRKPPRAVTAPKGKSHGRAPPAR